MDLDLVPLLNASFSQWNVHASAEDARGKGGVTRARVLGAPDGELWVLRQGPVPGSVSAALDTWSLARDPIGDVIIEDTIRSLAGLLMTLRRFLDPSFVPDRAIIGVRPPARPASPGRPRVIGPPRMNRDASPGLPPDFLPDLSPDLHTDLRPGLPGERLHVHVLTGFLGSGKTTLLNRLLREQRLQNTAVIVNEFGAIGIDHLLVERSDDRLVELAGGCVCCAVRGDLSVTLVQLLEARDSGRCLNFDRVVIETTGLADPIPVLNLLVTDPLLAERVQLGQVITTVDAVNGIDSLARHREALRQAAIADQLVITKQDLAPLAAEQLAVRLADINPGATQVRAHNGEVGNPVGLLGSEGGAARRINEPDDQIYLTGHGAGLGGKHHHGHGHGNDKVDVHGSGCGDQPRGGHQVGGIDTFTLIRTEPVPGAALALFVETLANHLGARLLRVKGLVGLAESPSTPAVLHGAQHVFHPVDFLARWPDNDTRTRLVFIGEGIEREWVERLLEGFIWEVDNAARRLQGV